MKLRLVFGVLMAAILLAAVPDRVTKEMGTPVAAITVEVYSDFQCPFCKVLHETWMPRLIHDYVVTGRVHLVQHEFPLPQHTYAKTAACYACAAERIGKYGEVCDILFKKQEEWEKDGRVEQTVCSVLTPAEAAKVRALAKDPAILEQVQRDVALGTKVPVGRTPTVIVTFKGRRYPVNVGSDYSYFAKLLDNLK